MYKTATAAEILWLHKGKYYSMAENNGGKATAETAPCSQRTVTGRFGVEKQRSDMISARKYSKR
jgi:hypothetical protein